MREASYPRLLALLLLTVPGFGACHGGCVASSSPVHAPSTRITVPRTRGPIKIDGHCAESSWQFAFRSPAFADASGQINPHAEFRAVADDDFLYFEVYVADVDVESRGLRGDIVKLDVGSIHLDLTPTGALSAPPGVRVAVFCDDTINNPKDNDEEWVTEVAIPWSLLGTHEVPVRAFRVDVGRNGPPHAMAWPRDAPALLRFESKSST